jgi:hypothetical protein
MTRTTTSQTLLDRECARRHEKKQDLTSTIESLLSSLHSKFFGNRLYREMAETGNCKQDPKVSDRITADEEVEKLTNG